MGGDGDRQLIEEPLLRWHGLGNATEANLSTVGRRQDNVRALTALRGSRYDSVSCDPKSPTKLLYDSGDHIHPSEMGYQTMASAFDLQLFKAAQQTTAAR